MIDCVVTKKGETIMSQCLRIVIVIEGDKSCVDQYLQNQAQKLHIEGIMQPLTDTTFRIVICGVKDAIETFLDNLQSNYCGGGVKNVECEPFFKEKDYRGVFRIIG